MPTSGPEQPPAAAATARSAPVARGAEPIALVVRSGIVESVHHGHVVALAGAPAAGGSVVASLGDPGVVVLPRSTLKPVQAVAMLRAGLDLDGPGLALACASHNGEPRHLQVVRDVLAGAGLDPRELANTPDWPLDDAAERAHRSSGRDREPLTQNCSGKHAAMLATCVAAGWDRRDYLAPDAPLQREVRATVEDLTGDPVEHVAVDGCGAPLLSCTLAGLARAFARIAAGPPGTPEGRVAAAMRSHPDLVGGTDRDVTALLAGVPGLVAKDGAEGVYAAALPDGRAAALKVLDGAGRPRPVVMVAALRALGVEAAVLDQVAAVPVLGHGVPVGAVEAVPLRSAGDGGPG